MWLVNNNSDDTVTVPRETFCHQWIFKYLWACKQDIVITYFKQRSRVFHFNFTSFDTKSFTWSYLILDKPIKRREHNHEQCIGKLMPRDEQSLLHTLRGDATFSLWPVVRKLASADNRSNVLTNHGGRVAEAASLAQPNNVNIETITNLSLKYLPSNPREHWLWTFDVSLITIMTTLPMF